MESALLSSALTKDKVLLASSVPSDQETTDTESMVDRTDSFEEETREAQGWNQTQVAYQQPRIRQMEKLAAHVTDTKSRGVQVVYVVQVTNPVTGFSWNVCVKYRQVVELYHRIRAIASCKKQMFWGSLCCLEGVVFHPRKINSFQRAVVIERVHHIETFFQRALSLVFPVPLGPRRLQVVNLVYEFLGASKIFRPTVVSINKSSNYVLEKLNKILDQLLAEDRLQVIQTCASFVRQSEEDVLKCRSPVLAPSQATRILREIQEKTCQLGQCIRLSPEMQRFFNSISCPSNSLCMNLRITIRRRVEELLLVPLEDCIAECVNALVPVATATALIERIRPLRAQSPEFFGISPSIICVDEWSSAIEELRNIDRFSLPIDKTLCLIASANATFSSHLEASENLPSSRSRCSSLCADEFLPIHIYVVVQSCSIASIQAKELLQLLCDSKDITGELGYYVTMYAAALEYTRTLDSTSKK